MRTGRSSAWVGFAFIALMFVFASVRIALRERPGALGGGRIRLTFAHYLVYESNRRCFDEVIRSYEELHPEVRIEQLDVPPVVWQAWRQTRFTGGTPPDIIQLGRGFNDDQFALHMLPLGEMLAEPNPYNVGTDLENVPWRETFVDGLMSSEGSFRERLQDFYGVTTYLNVLRVFYNRDLLVAITGRDEPPRTFTAFLELCARTQEWAGAHDRVVLPVAGSIEYSRNLFDRLMEHQTQRVGLRVDLEQDAQILNRFREVAVSWLREEWSLDEPALRAGWEMYREVSRCYQRGFLSASRDEAGFLFKQGRSLMIVTGSWDANYLMVDTPFRTGAFAIPLPSSEDGEYGINPLGRVTELAANPTGGFGVARKSAHPEVAVDFLRFLSSRAMNQKFADDCLRVPVVVGASVPAEIAAFAPETDGCQPGFNVSFFDWSSKVAQRHFATRIERLLADNGGVDEFIAAFGEGLGGALRRDLEFSARQSMRALQRGDAVELALWFAGQEAGGASAASRQRLARIGEFQTVFADAEHYQDRLVLSGAVPSAAEDRSGRP